jgi:hypothetical protein
MYDDGAAGGLDPLYRSKVLQPRAGLQASEWKAIPELVWTDRQSMTDAATGPKVFMRWFMAAVSETIGARGAIEFVALVEVDAGDEQSTYTLICPFEEPLELMRAASSRGSGEYLPKAGELTIGFHFGLLQEKLVPVVVACDPVAEQYSFRNLNQLKDPHQFANPFLCETTSGFLNFLGAYSIESSELVVMQDLDALYDRGLDEWFRWLYCASETGVSFDSARLLVKRDDPERWIYNYDGK